MLAEKKMIRLLLSQNSANPNICLLARPNTNTVKLCNVFAGRRSLLNIFVDAVREALEHAPSCQLDLELPVDNINTSLSSTPKSPNCWSFLDDSSIFTHGSGQSTTRSSQRTLMSTALRYQSTPVTAKSDVLVHGCRKRLSKSRRSEKTQHRAEKSDMRHKFGSEEKEESIVAADPEYLDPVRKRLCMEDSTTDAVPDILTACENYAESQEAPSPIGRSHSVSCAVGVSGETSEGGGGGEVSGSGKIGEISENGGDGEISGSGKIGENGGDGEISALCATKENGEDGEEGEKGDGGERGEEGEKGEGGERGEEGGKGAEEEGDSESSEDEDLPSFLTNSSTEVVGKYFS